MHCTCGYFKKIVILFNILFLLAHNLFILSLKAFLWQNLWVQLSACLSLMRSIEGQAEVSRVSRPTDSGHKEEIALFQIKWPSGTDRITGWLHKESCTWARCDPALLLSWSAYISDWESTSVLGQTTLHLWQRYPTYAHRGVQYRAGETPGCGCLFLVWRWDPMAGRQIWNGAWSSVVYQLQCYGQSVCPSVCLSDCLPTKETNKGGWEGESLLRLMSAKNKHNIPPKFGPTSGNDVKTTTKCHVDGLMHILTSFIPSEPHHTALIGPFRSY